MSDTKPLTVSEHFLQTPLHYRDEQGLQPYHKVKGTEQEAIRDEALTVLTEIAHKLTPDEKTALFNEVATQAPEYKTYWIIPMFGGKNAPREFRREIRDQLNELFKRNGQPLCAKLEHADLLLYYELFTIKTSEEEFPELVERVSVA